ncbi:MAG: hypothetical protein K8S87_03755 [Planctomycetes bacterium]|nr:hypothetical protein [Planctomycetota bacterium]
MNLLNIESFLIFAGEDGGIFQLVVAAIIILTSVIASAKGAKKKQEQEKEKQRLRQINASKTPSSNVPQTQQRKPQPAKFWGIPLEEIEESEEIEETDDDYVDYDDDDDYDPLEPHPARVQKSFAHKIHEPVFESDIKLGELQNKHLKSSVETKHLRSSIEKQTLDTQIESLDVMSGKAGGISGKVKDSGKSKVKIEITVPKGSSEALVHAVVLGEIFGPPITLRPPYNLTDEEEAFKKSTLI